MKEWIEITSLNFFPGNPRRIEPVMMERLKNSIREFSGVVPGASGGFRLPDPIIVNDVNKNIVGGNQRARALIELNQTKIHKNDISWVHIEDLQKEKALNIALNRITGDWDDEKLKEILMEMDNEFMNLSGFDDDDLADIVERLEAEALPESYSEKEIDELETKNECPKCGYKW